MDPTRPDPTHGWAQPMSNSVLVLAVINLCSMSRPVVCAPQSLLLPQNWSTGYTIYTTNLRFLHYQVRGNYMVG